MAEFNNMPEVNLCLLIFSIHVELFILIAVVTDHARKRTFMKNFAVLLISHILVQAGEAGIWYFNGKEKNVIMHYVSGIIYLLNVIIFLAEITIIIYYRKMFPLWGRFIALSNCAAQFVTMLAEDVWYSAQMDLDITLFMILIYVFFHGELTRQLAEQEKELSENRIAIMVSQIQPHFMYNALNSIYYLCDKDTELAKQAISNFSEYLRHSLSSIKRTTPVRAEEELRHVKTYLELEQMRFGEDLNVVYHIETMEFLVPALSIQPLVENAVKHGICKKEDGGTLIISTEEKEKYYEITVSDNGAGFNPQEIKKDGKPHVGIENVRQRLDAMCKGTLIIESAPGRGTVAIMRVPKENSDEDISC